MSVLRWCAWWILGVGLVLPIATHGAPSDSKKNHKLIVYPEAGETVAHMKARGASKVEDYGSYWIVSADKAQAETIKQELRGRALKADYLNRIELMAVQFDTTDGEPVIPNNLREVSAAGPQLRLIQFAGPVQAEWLELLHSVDGVKVINYVPNNAYIVRLSPSAEENLRQMVGPDSPIQWLGAYQPYYKLRHELLNKKSFGGAQTVDLRVAVADGPEADKALDEVRQYASGAVSQPYIQLNQKIIQLNARTSDIAKIAQLSDVLWVERVVPRELKDEKQDLISASRTNQLPGHGPVPITLGGEKYLEFLFDKVGGGLPAFTDSSTYPIVDIADTGLETGTTRPPHADFYEFGDRNLASRVVYNTRAGYPDGDGCPRWPQTLGGTTVFFFNDGSDFCGHGTFVASIVNGYSNFPSNSTTVCLVTNLECVFIPPPISNFVNTVVIETNVVPVTGINTEGFQFGLGVSPFGLIGSTRIFWQDLNLVDCNPFIVAFTDLSCEFCATSLPVLMAQEYIARARISNNSWGDRLVSTPEGELVNAGQYTVDSQAYDIGTRDAVLTGTLVTNVPGPSPLNQEMIFVFAGGNTGSQGNVGGFGDILVTAPATAKNIIAVGATENVRLAGDGCLSQVDQDNSYDVSGYSAFGTTLDGRFKPDLVAPGSSVYGVNSWLSFDPFPVNCPLDTAADCLVRQGVDCSAPLYSCNAGTSFSAPAVSGGAQLLWWYFQNRLNMLQPSPAMAKAYMLNSARYLPITNAISQTIDTLPSIAQGMGMMDLERMFDGVPRALRDESTPRAIDVTLLLTNTSPHQTYFSRTGQNFEMSGVIQDATKQFRVTLAWTDMPGSPAANGALVNDLDLQVTIGGKTYKGNIFAGPNSVVDINRGFDNINNVESVFLPAGQTGTWSVVVRATNIAGDGVPNVGTAFDQDFALVVYNATALSDVPTPTTNDACQTAASITNFPYTTTMNLSSAFFHNNHPSPSAAQGGIEAFWTLGRLTQNTVVRANTFGSNFDTVLSVWAGQCGSLVEVTSNNNISNTLQSAVQFTADGSNTYYLVADKRAGNNNKLELNVDIIPPPITLLPSPQDFGNVFVGSNSTAQTIIYANGSTQPVFIDSVMIQGPDAADFEIVDQTCESQTIGVDSNCFISIVFIPSHVGAHSATLVVTDNQTGSPRLAQLTGNGLTPAPVACTGSGSLTFTNTFVGHPSAPQTVSITNCGLASMFITNATFSGAAAGDYSITSDTCSGNSIAPGGSCDIGVTFTPTATGSRIANLQVNSNATNSPTTFTITGTGMPPSPQVCLSASALNFSGQEAGSTSAVQNVVVTNCGVASLIVNNATITGANASDFKIVSNICTNGPVATNSTCTIGIVFNPGLTNIANRTANLQIFDNAPGSPQSVTLNGKATGSQPDVLISKKAGLRKALGAGIINSTGDEQTLTLKIRRNKKKVLYIAFQNAGIDVDTFRVDGDGNVPSQLTADYFIGAKNFNGFTNNVTTAVVANSYSTTSLAAGAITGDSTMMRLQVTISPTAAPGTNDILITAQSSINPAKVDTVRARVIVR